MQCEHAQEFISEYVTGEMDRALAVTLENHLAACAACTETVDGLRRLWTTLDQMPLIDPPPSFHAALMEKISAEQSREERAARVPARTPAWSRLLQPRVFAYAAVALVLLVSVELVQVQRAALGPLGLVLNVAHPSPLLRTHKVDWTPNGQGGGTVTLRLQARAQANGAASRLHYQIELAGAGGASSANAIVRQGDVTSEQATTVELPLKFVPSTGAAVNITVAPLDAAVQDSQTTTVPLSPVQ